MASLAADPRDWTACDRRPIKGSVCGLPMGTLSIEPPIKLWCDHCGLYEQTEWVGGDEIFDLAG
jgi:hypothetical protein